MGLNFKLGTGVLLLFSSSALLAAGEEKLKVEVEEVATPGWIIDETEAAIDENRPAVYNEDQFVFYSDDDQPQADQENSDSEDDEVLPLLPPLDEPKQDPKKPSRPGIPSMDPEGGVQDGAADAKKKSKQPGDNDPFPPLEESDNPFPGDDDTNDDPFPPSGDDPIPGLPGDDDPFPPIGDPIDGGLPGFGDPFFPDPGWGNNYGPIGTIDQIVNLGHKVWKIIQENQPVIKAEYKYANAIPAGTAATDLEFFSPVQYKSFRIKLKNRFDTDVVDITYTTVHRYGGKYEGKGHFLERVSIVPSKIIAGYNYKINFNVTNVTVANVGSNDDPIASMGVDALIEYGSTFKKTSRRILFEFRGDSADVKQYRVD